MPHFYPAGLARFVQRSWTDVRSAARTQLLAFEALEELLSICYQASLLTEELRPVTFRVMLLSPDSMPLEDGPPRGYHRMCFTQPRALNPHTLRKLSPAVEYSHSLLGVQLGEKGFEIWGIVQSGARWVTSVYTGRRPFKLLPSTLVISVTGPGSLNVSDGSMVLAKLASGQLSAPGPELLGSDWVQGVFHSVRQELEELHISACASCPPVSIDPLITRYIAQGMLLRILQLLRTQGHGGTLIIVPPDMATELEQDNPFLSIGYRFLEEEPRRRYRTLLIKIMQRLAECFPEGSEVGWDVYHTCEDQQLSELDEALEEFSHLLASLGSVDGAVLLTQRMEILGFGVEIAGNLPPVSSIQLAKDVEGCRSEPVDTDSYGTRHRSAYRLCAQLPEVLAFVLSQDGRIQLVKQLNGCLTCWDQLSTGVRDI